MDIPPYQYIAFRVNSLRAVSIAHEVFNTIKVSNIKYIGLLRAPAFRLFRGMDTREGGFVAGIVLFIIVFIFYTASPKEKGYLLVITLACLHDCFIL